MSLSMLMLKFNSKTFIWVTIRIMPTHTIHGILNEPQFIVLNRQK